MAENRTNMVSLLDIGLLMGSTSKIVEMGDGYTELTESWGPEIDSKQYVNMKNKSSSLKGFAFSMSPEREYISDEMQKCIDYLLRISQQGKPVRHSTIDITRRISIPNQSPVNVLNYRLSLRRILPVAAVEIR